MLKFKKTFRAYFDGEGEGSGNPPPTPTPAKTFTQADVDRFMAEERRKGQAKSQQLVQELEQLRNSTRLSEEEKTALTGRIEEIQNQSLTKEQQLTRDLEKVSTTLKTTSESLTGERDTWRNRYSQVLVANAITGAASKHEAYNNDQILTILGTQAKVVEAKDEEGKGTGEFNVVIKFNDVDAKTKQPVVLELSAEDTVKRMKELPERFGNLFKSGVQAGVGKTKSGTTTSEANPGDMTTEQYRAWRKTRNLQ